MEYQSDRFSIGRRDVVAAWLVCALIAAMLFLLPAETPGSEAEGGSTPVALRQPAAPPPAALCAVPMPARHG